MLECGVDSSGRIPYFDLAKGVCILLIVWFHLAEYYQIHTFIDSYLSAVRMPLFFFLSGFFFKSYENFNRFFLKKVRQLFIPFAFFYLTTSVFIPIVAHKFLGIEFSTGQDWKLLYSFLTYNSFPNIPLWFLWGLFILNICFYGMCYSIRREYLLGVCCVIVYIVFGNYIHLPASLSCAFHGILFFYLGYIVNRHDLLIFILECRFGLLFFFLFLICGYVHTSCFFIQLLFRSLTSVSGILLLVFICAKVKHLPYVSYVGRYYIILLVTHEPLIRVLTLLGISNAFIAFFILAFSFLVIIPLMKKCLPYVISFA